MVMPVILVLAVVPFAKDTALADLNVGVLYVLAVTSLTSVAIFMAGWSSNNRYAMFGAVRGVAVLISYEVPVVLCLLGVVLVAGSMSLSGTVAAQTVPFLLVQPLALFVFLAGTSAELNRTPFDVAEAESELIAGYHIEYSGVKFALIQTAEIGGVLTASAVTVTLFLSGWSGPASSYLGWLWFAMKVAVIAFLICLGPGYVSPPPHRSDYGPGVEVSAALEHNQPVRHLPGGVFLEERPGRAHFHRSVDHGGDQPGRGSGVHRSIRHLDSREGQTAGG